jgi:hypothetical protein
LFAHLPSRPLLLGILNNAAHAPVFGLLAVVASAMLRPAGRLRPAARYALAFAFAVTVGGLVEIVQPAFGHSTQWRDLVTDALGAVTGLAIVAWLDARGAPRLRRAAFAGVAAAAALPVIWPIGDALLGYAARVVRFPTLLVPASHADRYFLRTRGVTVEVARLPAPWAQQDDESSLHLRITGTSWPGVSLDEPAADWSGRSHLVLDLTNPAHQPLALTLRVHDAAHDNRADDRFNRRFELPPARRQRLRIPLADVASAPAARQLDLTRIAGLAIFASGAPAELGRDYYLTRIWLE